MNGLVLIDKPGNCTSHDVVNRWRRLAGLSRAGHLGTLDPMATGLLLIVSGTATRLASFFKADEKTYDAEITLGQVSDTYDREGEVMETNEPIPDASTIEKALGRFRGNIPQVPPPISAKKINGVAAYKLARRNVKVKLEPVAVTIHSLNVLAIERERICVRVRCSSGTYIRSIAHDLGQTLGCGGLLSSLRRTTVGDRHIDGARSLDQLALLAREGRLAEAVIPSARILPWMPAQHVDDLTEQHIRNGREFRTLPFTVPSGAPFVRVISRSGELISVGELRYPNVYRPKIVL